MGAVWNPRVIAHFRSDPVFRESGVLCIRKQCKRLF